MQTESILCFPLPAEKPKNSKLFVRDLDIVGVTGVRKDQLLQLQETNQFVLLTHEDLLPDGVREIYQAELQRTLKWLKPVEVEVGSNLDLQVELLRVYEKVFPQTSKALGIMSDRMSREYLQEMDWSSWLLQEHWRYFSGFLRLKYSNQSLIYETAHFEWAKAWLEIQGFEAAMVKEDGVAENSALQTVALTQKNEYLDRDQGLYALVYDRNKSAVAERTLDVYEALILDTLREDRSFSLEQLVEFLRLDANLGLLLSKEQWEKKCFSLREDAILTFVM